MRKTVSAIVAVGLLSVSGFGESLPRELGSFLQQVSVTYSAGLPELDVRRLAIAADGTVYVVTATGMARLVTERFEAVGEGALPEAIAPTLLSGELDLEALSELPVQRDRIADMAVYNGEVALATAEGLYLGDGKTWELAFPREGHIRWAPLDVRVVAFDDSGQLWFGCPQGLGYRIAKGEWKLFTGAEGLPFNDFTCMDTGASGVWFGTTNGALRYVDGAWEFRGGRRWLAGNAVRDIAIDAQGNAWLATDGGVSCIAFRPMTLAQKAQYFEEEIDRYHRRTPFGFVAPADLTAPGDRSTATVRPTDNDGQFTGLYLAAESWAYAATGEPLFKARAQKAFEAVAFLGTVTEGGSPPGRPGYIARCIVPTDGPNPNETYSPERDRRIQVVRDKNWRVMEPRWPVDETGKWYWLSDTSTDELNGHFFAFAVYYDFACNTEAEKAPVREAVRRIADHLIAHNHTLIDYDGSPTRWGRFSPDELNRSEEWIPERGLNSMSALAYMLVAHHVTGEQKYRDEYLRLALDEGYAMNAATHGKYQSGPGSFGQGDDNKAFLHYYLLLRYETDPKLRQMYYHALHQHWQIVKYEDNAFFNFIYAVHCRGVQWESAFVSIDLSPPEWWLDRSIESLQRFPWDLVNWPVSNAHRIDILPLPDHTQEGGDVRNLGYRVNGRVLPVDERPLVRLGGLGDEPWWLSSETNGLLLRDGIRFLLPYYMGKALGLISD